MPKTRQPTSFETIHILGHAQVTPAHVHSQGHVVYPATGVLSLVTEAGSWIAPQNRAVWVPAGFTHQHRAHGRADMRIMFIEDQLAGVLPPVPVVLGVSPLARELALALTGAVDRSEDRRGRLRAVLLDELRSVGEQPLHLPEPRDERLRAVTRLVEHDLSTPLTLDHIGRRIGVSERTLTRLFHHETGMSFRQWRTQLRVHRALLLLNDGMAVLDVALACGWANPSSFIQAFTDLVGQTPGEYRRSLKQG